ncbi:MAG: gamma-glutamylcyclotransferase family protein [Clostridiaceae bacterium]
MSNRMFAAYGVGLNRSEMVKHCPTAKPIGTTELKNFRLAFRGGNACAVATIEKAKGGSVPALLWEITSQDVAALDRWIGMPELYRKITVKVRLNGAATDAYVYILIGNKPPNRPSAFYYSTLLEGYKAAGFDAEILKAAILGGSTEGPTAQS